MTADDDMDRQRTLRRQLGPLLLAVYGAGTILGAGIYVLIATTSLVMLLVFAASNLALIRLERRRPAAPFDTPRWVPWLGLLLCGALILGRFLLPGGGH